MPKWSRHIGYHCHPERSVSERSRRTRVRRGDTARKQSATLFQLKAAIELAGADKSESGAQYLRDLCANLPADFDAPDITEAKRLLAA